MIISNINPSNILAAQAPKKYVKALSISEKSLLLNVGQREAIFYKVSTKGKMSKKITAKTSNSNVKVTIQKNKINILAQKVGTSKITIYTQGKNIKNKKIKKDIKISVTKNTDFSKTTEIINSYDTFYLEGKKITVPISVSELLILGFRTDISDDAILTTTEKSIKTNIYNSTGKRLAEVNIINTTDSDIKIRDGIINRFSFPTNIDVKLYRGISFFSTKKQVYDICGEPNFHVYTPKDYDYDNEKYNPSKVIHVYETEIEENIKDPDYIPTSSYRWCNNYWFTCERAFNRDLGAYVIKEIYNHYLEVTFDNNDNIRRIIFAFDPKSNAE